MILTGPEIVRQHGLGAITIEPFDLRQVNPNSYNYRLGRYVVCMSEQSPDQTGVTRDLTDGPLVLRPNTTYLGHTLETIGSRKFVTLLGGRSSMGRLGLFLNFSADLGHVGSVHSWTLELKVVQPLRVYFGMLIGQATFWMMSGKTETYEGSYGSKSVPTKSLYDLREKA